MEKSAMKQPIVMYGNAVKFDRVACAIMCSEEILYISCTVVEMRR